MTVKRQIKLLKDHESPEGCFKAGDTIEVDVGTYNWLMQIYLEDRKRLVEALRSVPNFMKDDKDD